MTPDPVASSVLRPEYTILLACARRDLDPLSLTQIARALEQQIDWTMLFAAAESGGLLPLLAFHSRREFPDAVPALVSDNLRESFALNARAAHNLTRELLEIMHSFQAGGVDALPYKGPFLSMEAYGDISLRKAGDLDIFVRWKDFQKARELLLERGYSSQYSLTAGRCAALYRDGNHEMFADADGLRVELHWKTSKRVYPFEMNHDELWNRSGFTELAGRRLRTIAVEDLLLMLAVHGSSHAWSRLEWATTYGQLLRDNPDLDWPSLIERASRFGIERVLRVAVILASSLTNVAFPKEITAWLTADPHPAAIANRVKQRLLGGNTTRLAEVAYQFDMRKGIASKIRLAKNAILTPSHEDWKLANIPDQLYALYYPVRIFRLLSSYLTPGIIRR